MRIPLLPLTAAASAIAVIANGMAVAQGGDGAQQETRLGKSIRADMQAQQGRDADQQRSLDLREQALKAAQARMKRQMADSKAQQDQAQADKGGSAEATAEERFAELARIYQAMKPARAALVMEKLSPDVQLRIAQNMRERNAGLIMAAMTPQGAASLSMALARGEPVSPRPAKPAKR
tara:strand:- start:657 stop:1190 length:534 start_codon:yes stop_codon:yes gene_type:complete